MSAEQRVVRRVSAAVIVVLGLAGPYRGGVRGDRAGAWPGAGRRRAEPAPLVHGRRGYRRGARLPGPPAPDAFGPRAGALTESGAADEAVRSFAAGLLELVPLDDLLLQAAESLRTSLGLVSADFGGGGDALSLTFDPEHRRARSLGTADMGSTMRAGVWARLGCG